MDHTRKLVLGGLVWILCVAVFGISTAHAELLAYEGFNYTAGSNIVGQNGGTGWAGAWDLGDASAGTTVTQAGSLSYSDTLGNALATTGGKLLNSAIGSGTASQEGRTLNFRRGADGASGSTWFSFIGQRVDAAPYAGGANLTLFDSTLNPAPNTTDQKMNIGKNSNQNIGGVSYWHMNHVGIPATVIDSNFPESNPNTGQARFYFSRQPVENLTFYVARIDHNAGVSNGAVTGTENGNDDYRFWINPALNATPSDASANGKYIASEIVALADALGVAPFTPAPVAGAGVGGELSFQRIRMFARANDTAWVFDEFRVGTTFTDVAPIAGPAGTIGDYNGSGKVDAADYAVWRDNVGNAGNTLLNRDPANGAGAVGPGDYSSWKKHFGEPPGSGSLSAAGVPEPGSIGLIGLGLLAATALRRRTV